MASLKYNAQLIVEGRNDKHVILALCKTHDVEQVFSIETPNSNNGGVSELLNSIPVRLKIPQLETLGIVLDADQNLEARWQSIKHKLASEGYDNLPDVPNREGTIINSLEKPKVGVWIMPNNHLPGLLENFVAQLIPSGDVLAQKAEDVLQEIEQEDANKYPLIRHPKAFIHTWLAWQESPGRPMGQAITAHCLQYDTPLANLFIEWLRKLFVHE